MEKKWIASIIFCVSFMYAITSYAELKDPTEPFNYSNQSLIAELTKKIVLNAILISSERRIAVINGVPLQVGDHILNYQLLTIFPHAVEVKGPEGLVQIPLLDADIKQ